MSLSRPYDQERHHQSERDVLNDNHHSTEYVKTLLAQLARAEQERERAERLASASEKRVNELEQEASGLRHARKRAIKRARASDRRAARANPAPPVYPTVQEATAKVEAAFADAAKFVALIGQMQCGKSDFSASSGYEYALSMCVDRSPANIRAAFKKHVFYLGMYSDNSLIVDNKAKVLQWMMKHHPEVGMMDSDINYYHRRRVNKMVKVLDSSNGRARIFMDEVHLASGAGCTVQSELKKAGIYKLRSGSKKYQVVVISATGAPILRDLLAYGSTVFRKVYLQPGEGYVGVEQLIKSNRVYQARNFNQDPEAAQEMVRRLIYGDAPGQQGGRSGWGEDVKKVNLIRVPKAKGGSQVGETAAESHLKSALADAGLLETDYVIRHYDSDDSSRGRLSHSDFTTLLSDVPDKLTFVFVKEYLRCGATLPKTHIGILYDSVGDYADTTVISQSLLGRMCEYSSRMDIDNDDYLPPVVFTNLDSANEWVDHIKQIENSSPTETNMFGSKYTSRPIQVNHLSLAVTGKPTIFGASKMVDKLKSVSSSIHRTAKSKLRDYRKDNNDRMPFNRVVRYVAAQWPEPLDIARMPHDLDSEQEDQLTKRRRLELESKYNSEPSDSESDGSESDSESEPELEPLVHLLEPRNYVHVFPFVIKGLESASSAAELYPLPEANKDQAKEKLLKSILAEEVATATNLVNEEIDQIWNTLPYRDGRGKAKREYTRQKGALKDSLIHRRVHGDNVWLENVRKTKGTGRILLLHRHADNGTNKFDGKSMDSFAVPYFNGSTGRWCDLLKQRWSQDDQKYYSMSWGTKETAGKSASNIRSHVAYEQTSSGIVNHRTPVLLVEFEQRFGARV